jgi:hypothetical protein
MSMDETAVTPVFPPPPRNPAPAPPERRPGSVRRTSTILMHWPGGRGAQLRLDGRARDLFTPRQGEPVVVAEATMSVGVGAQRTIDDIASDPHRPGIEQLVGAQGGGGFRSALNDALPGERDAGTPLYLMLDDIAGSSLIAGFAWSRWNDDWKGSVARNALADAASLDAARSRRMEGICSGFRPGASALAPGGLAHNVAPVPPLADPTDPVGWHDLQPAPPVAMRRARRVDVWPTADGLAVDAMFRDSCWQPDGVEVAVHEYRVEATIDRTSWLVTSVVAEPRVLPFPECPGAAPNVDRLVGVPVGELRSEVLRRLRSVESCTHLNDALRSMAEVPTLVASLEGAG